MRDRGRPFSGCDNDPRQVVPANRAVKVAGDPRESALETEHAVERLLTNRQAAALLGIGVPTFYAMLKERQLPSAYYVRPYTPRWKASELLAAVGCMRGYPDQMKGHARRMKTIHPAKLEQETGR
jgi:predicted DNA-binding transcriptional regulator AlpA